MPSVKRSVWQSIFSLCAAASILLFLAIVTTEPLFGEVSLAFTSGRHFSVVHTLVGTELVIPTWGHFATEGIGLGSPLILWILLAIPGIRLFQRRAVMPRRLRSQGFPVIEKPRVDKDASDRAFQ